MAAKLELLDADGEALALDDDGSVDFGTVTAGATGEPVQLTLRNGGDADVYFARIRAAQHPTGQVGSATDTFRATEFALREEGNYDSELELGTLGPGEERSFWVRWAVPREAPAGALVWAVEALGSVT